MSPSRPKTYIEAGFTFEEIQRIESSTAQANAGMLIPEGVVWENIRKNSRSYA